MGEVQVPLGIRATEGEGTAEVVEPPYDLDAEGTRRWCLDVDTEGFCEAFSFF